MAAGLVLASSSRWRAAQLRQLGLEFTVADPAVDEAALPGEAPRALAERLAAAKARAVAARIPDSLVLAGDQVAELDGRAIGKPGTLEAARAQLAAASGRELLFHSAIALLTPDGCLHHGCDLTRVVFRELDAATIERYLAAEPALDCAGSFRCEGLGISLFERIESVDPSALVGLPLILAATLLREAGLQLP